MTHAVLAFVGMLVSQVPVLPVQHTAPVGTDVGDPAIWVNRAQPAQSLILGLNREKAPKGCVVALALDGKVKRRIQELDAPHGIDVETNVKLGAVVGDVAVVAETGASRLRVYKIDAVDGGMTEIGGVNQLAEAPLGVALYKRPSDGALFAYVAPVTSRTENRLTVYQLNPNAAGKIDAKEVGRLGSFSGRKGVDSLCIDDELGVLYYNDELFGIRRYSIRQDPPTDLGLIKISEYYGSNKGLAIYAGPNGSGYLVCADRVTGDSYAAVYGRKEQESPVGIFHGGADATEGLDACSTPMGNAYPAGIVVTSNLIGGNYLIWNWADIAAKLKLP